MFKTFIKLTMDLQCYEAGVERSSPPIGFGIIWTLYDGQTLFPPSYMMVEPHDVLVPVTIRESANLTKLMEHNWSMFYRTVTLSERIPTEQELSICLSKEKTVEVVIPRHVIFTMKGPVTLQALLEEIYNTYYSLRHRLNHELIFKNIEVSGYQKRIVVNWW